MFHRATMGKGAVYYSVNISQSLPLSPKKRRYVPITAEDIEYVRAYSTHFVYVEAIGDRQ